MSVPDPLTIAFDHAPVGLVFAEDRVIKSCNRTFAEMLGYHVPDLIGQSFRMFYGSQEEFAQIRDVGLTPLQQTGVYTDERMVRHKQGHSIWCRFRAHALDQSAPLSQVAMSFAQITEQGDRISLSTRQRQVLGLMSRGMTSKEIARELSLSPRTIEDVRARLLRKFHVKNASELLVKMTDLSVFT